MAQIERSLLASSSLLCHDAINLSAPNRTPMYHGTPSPLRAASVQYVCMYGHTYSKSTDQPGKVASPARGQLNRKNEYFPVRVRA